jgi:hypothetical protein
MKRNVNRRYLRPMKLGKHSPDFYVFDTETGIHKKDGTGDIEYILSARPEHLIFGCVYGPNGYRKVIHNVEEFKKEFLKRMYKNKMVYAHNAEYDLSCLYGNIYHMDKGAIFNGKFISASNGVCRFADSFNLLPTSVKKLGVLLGLHKMDLGQNLKSNVKNLSEDIKYCMRDCEIVYKSLEILFRDSEPSYTIGSLALKIFRANFLKKSIKVNALSDTFFDCLYGGRTEAFRIDDVRANVYDINSAYPFAMDQLRLPDPGRLRLAKTANYKSYLSDKSVIEKTTETGASGLDDYYTYEGMIDATITIPDSINIPMLPFRTTDKLLFPVGTFRGSWTLNEFRYAYFNFPVTVEKVHRLIVSESIESPFKEFIQHFWKIRQATNDKFVSYLEKLKMNNLYGKTIQRARDEFRFCESIGDAKDFMKKRKIKRVELIEVNGGYFLKYDIDKIFSHTIACWGAYITAFVRIMLHKEIMRYPNETVYCDTDSVFRERDENMNDKNLGGWKKEEKIVTKIRALKDYVYWESDENGKAEKKQMLKGVKKDATQLDEEANVFKTKRMVKTRESFRRVDNLPPGTFIEQLKVLTGDYSKRHILKDGFTKPFKLKL